MDYLDFGSDSSDSDHEDEGGRMLYEMDSDEEERFDNKRLLDILSIQDPPTKNQRCIQDFEAEMEAELDRRALEIESQGGMEHQKSLSRSSSTTSLNKSPRASPVPGSSGGGLTRKSNLKRAHSTESCSGKKTVKFDIPEKSTATSLSTKSEEMITSTEENNKSTSESSEAKYDELYFDSDESDGEDENKKGTKESRRRFMTDDELFYDPTSDAQDQLWIDNQRRLSYGESCGAPPSGTQKSNQASSSSGGVQQQQQPTPNSSGSKTNNVSLPCTDAVLNCPACFTTLCHDCQRHELYVGQYRAMFVMNCVINKQEILKVPEKVPKKFRKLCKKATTTNQFTSNGSSDVFHPVLCKVCKTQIAMYDSEEVFHFFNVLASQP